jgi:hypothetical protein
VCHEVVPRGQFSSLRGARRWQRHPILALPRGCRAEKLMWALTRGGDVCILALNRSRKWKFRILTNRLLKKSIDHSKGARFVAANC